MTFEIGQIFENTYAPEVAVWCNENNAFIEEIEKIDGVRQFQIVAIPEPTIEEVQVELQRCLTSVVQNALDSFAQTKGYDGIMSACSYVNSTDPVFKAEAEYCIRLRDETWRMGYTILDEVKAGIRPIPSEDELLALLPVGSANWTT